MQTCGDTVMRRATFDPLGQAGESCRRAGSSCAPALQLNLLLSSWF